jgi:HSP20 family protein
MNYLSPFWKKETTRSIFDEMDDFFTLAGEPIALRNSLSQPACDVAESDSHYLISMDLPGMKLDDIKIEINNDFLMISGERKFEKKSTSKDSYVERQYGRFERSFRLGDKVDASNVEAHYDNGVLNVAVTKRPEARPKSIEIQTGKKSGLIDTLLGSKNKEHKVN